MDTTKTEGGWSLKRLANWPIAYLLLFVVAYAAATLYWVMADVAPPEWDQSWYLETAERMYSATQDQGLLGFLQTYVHAFAGIKAPLISLIPQPFYWITGDANAAVLLTHLLLILAFSFSYYRLMRHFLPARGALFALIVTCTMPLAFGLSRHFLVEFGLTVIVVLWIWTLLDSNSFQRTRMIPILGVLIGFGLLMKISFPLYIVGPTFVGMLKSVRAGARERKNAILSMLAAGLIGVAIAATWYGPNWQNAIGFAYSAGLGSLAQDYSYGPSNSVATYVRYWLSVLNLGLSPYYGLLLLLIAITIFIRRIRSRGVYAGNDRASYKRFSSPILWSWFGVPFIVFSIASNRDYRFLLPALPAVGGLIAVGLTQLLASTKPKFQTALMALALAFPVFAFLHGTFNLPFTKYVAGRNLIWLSADLGYVTRPNSQIWPQEFIIEAIERDARKIEGSGDSGLSTILAMLIVDHRYFNQNNFSYFAAMNRSPVLFSAVLTGSSSDWPDRRQYLLTADYLLTKTGDQGPDFTTYMNEEIGEMLRAQHLPYVEVASFDLPDSSRATLYRRLD